jgi:hypothetical protein
MSVYTLYHTLCDAGFEPACVSKAIDVLRGTDEPEPDDAYGDPASWPATEEIDGWRWTIGPDPDDDGPTDADLDEMARIAELQDRLEQMHLITDRDIEANGLAVG